MKNRYFFALLLFLCSLAYAQIAPIAQHSPPEIEIWQLTELPNAIVINSDSPYQGEISGTHVFIPYHRVEDFFSVLPRDKNRPLIVYAAQAEASNQAAQALVTLGYRQVYRLAGTPQTWAQSTLGFVDVFAISGGRPAGVDFDRLSSYLGIPRTRFVRTSSGENAILGSASGQLFLVEFSDFNCPYCAVFHKDTFPALKQEYIDTGKLRYVHRDFVSVGGNMSQQAAEILECAREQLTRDNYFGVVQAVYLQQGRRTLQTVKNLLVNYPVDTASLDACFNEGRYTNVVNAGRTAARAASIRGTPGFVLGYLSEEGVIEGIRISGAVPLQTFRENIAMFIASQE